MNVVSLAAVALSSLLLRPDAAQVRHVPEPARDAWMQTDSALAKSVSLSIHGRPLREALAALSKAADIQASAERDMEEYRVSLDSTQQPAARVMGRLLDLFGHGRIPSNSYYWDRRTGEDKVVRYVLCRSRAGMIEEAQMLDAPRATTMRWLRQLRDYARMSEADRKQAAFDCPAVIRFQKNGTSLDTGELSPVGGLLASLTDQQITALVAEGRVQVPQYEPSAEAMAALRNAPSSSRRADAPPEARPDPDQFGLGMTSEGREGRFTIWARYRAGVWDDYNIGVLLDTQAADAPGGDDEAIEAAAAQEKGPVLDLLAHLKRPDGAPPDAALRTSLTTALALLAREAHINVYAEIFLKDRRPVRYTRGKPEYLLTRICADYGCDWRKVGTDFVVYSKSWAQDRASDISDPLLARWAARHKAGPFEIRDFVEMAALTDRQLPTLQKVFGLLGPLAAPNVNAVRLLGLLPPGEQQAAFRPAGVPLRVSTDRQVEMLRRYFGRQEIRLPVFVRLEKISLTNSQSKGIAVHFADRIGPAARSGWIYAPEVRAQPEPDDGAP